MLIAANASLVINHYLNSEWMMQYVNRKVNSNSSFFLLIVAEFWEIGKLANDLFPVLPSVVFSFFHLLPHKLK